VRVPSLLRAAGIAPAPRDLRPLPLIALFEADVDRSRYLATTTIDDRGRLADRTPLKVLGWEPGRSLTIATLPEPGIVVVRGDGPNAVTRQGHLRLPAEVRRGCRLAGGDRLLVAAHPDHDVLVAYNVFAVEAMLLAYHAGMDAA
jgi:hypothetical protein